MATANSSMDFDDFITCGVCLCEYDDLNRKPKFLSCAARHTVCLPCLRVNKFIWCFLIKLTSYIFVNYRKLFEIPRYPVHFVVKAFTWLMLLVCPITVMSFTCWNLENRKWANQLQSTGKSPILCKYLKWVVMQDVTKQVPHVIQGDQFLPDLWIRNQVCWNQ